VKSCLFIVPIVGSALVCLSGQQWETSQRVDTDRANRFHRDVSLIETMVEGGLCLAKEETPLLRAECCTALAQQLATAVRHAAKNHDHARVEELGQHLRTVLDQGVAVNLSETRKHVPANSSVEKKIEEVRRSAASLVEPLEEELEQASAPQEHEEFQNTLQALRQGRAELERLRAPTPP